MEYIISVDRYDNELGPIEKMEAHEKGILHRAFSICVFNSKNQWLLQRRNTEKYHSGGLWTNTCCSHPRYGELFTDAVNRRLMEEMGFTCKLDEIFSFSYQVDFDNQLTENEYDHVFMGYYEGEIIPNPNEVEDYRWVSIEDLSADMEQNPESYTFWFRELYPKIVAYLEKKMKFS